MEPGAILFDLLKQAAPVVALLGYVDKSQAQQYRIYPLRAPQGTPYPYATYQVVSGQANSTMGCDLDDDARVQLSLFAATYEQITQLHLACRRALHGREVGSALVEFDTYQESFQDNALCFLRTQDYLLSGLAAPEADVPPLPVPPAPTAPYTDPATGDFQFVLPAGYDFDTLQVLI
ncbi:MAG: DUF3168 domain-containing protein [Janthinobacterium lividum]